jgi:hypothetical protein
MGPGAGLVSGDNERLLGDGGAGVVGGGGECCSLGDGGAGVVGGGDKR